MTSKASSQSAPGESMPGSGSLVWFEATKMAAAAMAAGQYSKHMVVRKLRSESTQKQKPNLSLIKAQATLKRFLEPEVFFSILENEGTVEHLGIFDHVVVRMFKVNVEAANFKEEYFQEENGSLLILEFLEIEV